MQPGDALTDIALALHGLDAAQGVVPACRGLAHRGQRVIAKRVQQGQLGRTLQQGLMFVLAMDLDQHFAQLAQLTQGGRTAIDPGLGAAVGAQHPAQLAAIPVIQLLLAQPEVRRRVAGEPEVCGEFGSFCAVPNHGGIGPRSAQQQQRID